MPGNYSKLVTVITGQTITAAERNNEFDNVINNMTPAGVDDASANLAAMQATVDPAGGSLATTLAGELQRLRFQLLKLGAASGNWYDALPFLAGITPASAGATGTDLNNRLAQLASQIKNLGGLTNWYDAVTAALLKAGGTMAGNIAMGGFKVTGAGAASTAGDVTRYEQLNTLWGYRRPVLKWINVTTIDVENNTGNSNETTILFPDGTARTVVEDTSAANKYRRFVITAAAEFTSGTEDSGIRSGISEATNTWYAIFAVKSVIDATKFVLAGDTTLPIQANFTTLNSRYGTNGWVYLGLIRNGDGGSTTGDILNFYMGGDTTIFKAQSTGGNYLGSKCGLLLNTSASNTSLGYTYAAGTAGTAVPNNILFALWQASREASASEVVIIAQRELFRQTINSGRFTWTGWAQIIDGIALTNGSAVACDVILLGYTDTVLGVGSNPVL